MKFYGIKKENIMHLYTSLKILSALYQPLSNFNKQKFYKKVISGESNLYLHIKSILLRDA